MITPNDYLRAKMLAVQKSKQEISEMLISGEIVLQILDGYKDEVLKNMESSSRIIESADRLILLHRKPNTYEIHRNKIAQKKNLILSTSDEEFATQLVERYNQHTL